MKFDSILELLKTISFYNTVSITQTFAKDGEDYLVAKTAGNSTSIVVTCIATQEDTIYDDIKTAAEEIERTINDYSIVI
ncbi:MAG TPA: hypothetical protein VLQ20_05975 [Planococcus sp. (in: firmicutes)]|nr:hypothetical protein [Planococcus sp. (in: firmicutes)]